jgi:glutathione S-transferase
MTLTLHCHPLASFCHKVLIALYENETPFTFIRVDLGDQRSSADFRRLWPLAKMPVLRDEARDFTVAESTAIIEYLDAHYPAGRRFIPRHADGAWQTRLMDRIFDHYVHEPMQKIVTDRLRPAGHDDAYGVEQAKRQLYDAYRFIEVHLQEKTWAIGEDFTLADCSAAPALFYANTVAPFEPAQQRLAAYLNRLMARPSYARVLREAEPYFNLFPLPQKPALAMR